VEQHHIWIISLTLIGGAAGLIKWCLWYIESQIEKASERDLDRMQGYADKVSDLQHTVNQQWERLDVLKERLIGLEATCINETKVRQLIEEHRAVAKQDTNEIKAILQTVIENVESLKVSIAVTDALRGKDR